MTYGLYGRTCQARRVDAPLVAAVTGGRDHDDALLPGLLDRVGQRIDLGRLGRVGAVGEVDHADVQTVVVAMLDHPVDRRDHLRHVHPAVGNTDLDRDDPRIRRHPAVGGRRRARIRRAQRRVLARDQAGHERAMPVRVEIPQRRALRLEREVGPVDDLAGSGETLDRAHTRVDHRDIDAGTRVARVPPRRRTAVRGRVRHRVHVSRRVVRARTPAHAHATDERQHHRRHHSQRQTPPRHHPPRPSNSTPRETGHRKPPHPQDPDLPQRAPLSSSAWPPQAHQTLRMSRAGGAPLEGGSGVKNSPRTSDLALAPARASPRPGAQAADVSSSCAAPRYRSSSDSGIGRAKR